MACCSERGGRGRKIFPIIEAERFLNPVVVLKRKLFGNIPLYKKKLVGRRHWTGNEVETSEALEVAGICTNKGRLSFESAMLL